MTAPGLDFFYNWKLVPSIPSKLKGVLFCFFLNDTYGVMSAIGFQTLQPNGRKSRSEGAQKEVIEKKKDSKTFADDRAEARMAGRSSRLQCIFEIFHHEDVKSETLTRRGGFPGARGADSQLTTSPGSLPNSRGRTRCIQENR